jgi:threonine/homoserine/homoserine lactone efflux protein
LTTVFVAVPTAYTALKFAGAAYLCTWPGRQFARAG